MTAVLRNRKKHQRFIAAGGGGLRPPDFFDSAPAYYVGADLTTDGSGDVVAWPNRGTLGSDGDLNVIARDKGDSSIVLINEHKALKSAGNYGLRPTVAQVISAPFTVMAVARYDSDPPTGFESLIANLGGTALQMYADSSGVFGVYRGSILNLPAASFDNEVHIHTLEAGSPNSTYTVSDVNAATGNAGAGDFSLGSVLVNGIGLGGEGVDGALAEWIVWDSAVSSENKALGWAYFAEKYGLVL